MAPSNNTLFFLPSIAIFPSLHSVDPNIKLIEFSVRSLLMNMRVGQCCQPFSILSSHFFLKRPISYTISETIMFVIRSPMNKLISVESVSQKKTGEKRIPI